MPEYAIWCSVLAEFGWSNFEDLTRISIPVVSSITAIFIVSRNCCHQVSDHIDRVFMDSMLFGLHLTSINLSPVDDPSFRPSNVLTS